MFISRTFQHPSDTPLKSIKVPLWICWGPDINEKTPFLDLKHPSFITWIRTLYECISSGGNSGLFDVTQPMHLPISNMYPCAQLYFFTNKGRQVPSKPFM